MHSADAAFQGNSLYYMERDLGTQTNYAIPFAGFPQFLSAWTDRPVTFKKDYSYLVNVQMENLYFPIPKANTAFAGATGTGLVDALTYFELIV